MLGGGGGGGGADPAAVLRHMSLRLEWQRRLGNKERVPWRDFWYRLVQPQAHAWGLESKLDKFSVDFLQHQLERGPHGRLTLEMLDFAFPPHAPISTAVAAMQQAHIQFSLKLGPSTASLQSSGPLSGLGAPPALGSARMLGGGGGLTPEVTPGLHYFPEVLEGKMQRDQDLSDLVLSMQDISTNLVVLIGPAGSGRSALAAALASDLVASGHWVEAYWADLGGIISATTAGVQLLACTGLITDAPDPSQLLAWLESRSGERFGVVVAHTDRIMGGPADDQAGLLDFVDRMLQACPKLQIVLVSDDHLQRTAYNARTLELGPLPPDAVAGALRAAQPDLGEEVASRLADACNGSMLALQVVSGLLSHGYCGPSDLIRLLSDPNLPTTAGGPLGGGGGSASDRRDSGVPNSERECLQRLLVGAMVALPEDLGNAILVLSLLPAPFTYDDAAQLLAHPPSGMQRRGLLRRLVALGLLAWQPGRRLYSVPGAVREAALVLAGTLGMEYAESRMSYLRHVLASVKGGAAALHEAGFHLAAFVAWQQHMVPVAQIVSQTLSGGVREDELPLLTDLLWDALPLMTRTCSGNLMQGFCQKLLDKATLLDRRADAARVGTQFGWLLAEAGAYRRAEPLLRNALELMWREARGPHPYTARCYAVLGSMLARAGKLQEAAVQLQQAIELMQVLAGVPINRAGGADAPFAGAADGSFAAGGPGDADALHARRSSGSGGLLPAGVAARLLPVLLQLAEVRRRQRRFAEAEGLCRRALGVAGMCYPPSHPEVAAAKSALAQVFRISGALPEAGALHQEALAMLEAALGPEHPKVAAALAALGSLALQRGNAASAEQYYRKALQVYQAVQGLGHPETSATLAQLVSLLRGANKAANALPLAQRCLSIKQQLLGDSHAEVAAAMQTVADVMLDLGRYSEVEKLCSRAASILLQAGTSPAGRGGSGGGSASLLRPTIVAQTMQALALVLMGRPAEAEQLVRTCLEAAERQLPPEGPAAAERARLVASASNCLSEALRELGRLEDAEGACRKGLALREKEFGPDHPAVALSLQSLALVLRARQQLPAAAEAATRCLGIRAQHKSTADGPLMAAALNLKALVALDSDDLGEALNLAQKGLEIRQKALASDHPDLAQSLACVAEALLLLGRRSEAEPKLTAAVQILIARLGSSHPATQRAHVMLKEATIASTTGPSALLRTRRRRRRRRRVRVGL
ncbi:MAG: hypothetical protein J3K34DRAFT_120548 [Monoraphidium minutum]|nr:MAG: hypothetical protein J3K34DRAFT_120548 [Monoraphidium minutum]